MNLPPWLADAVMGLVTSAYQAGVEEGRIVSAPTAVAVAEPPRRRLHTRYEAAQELGIGPTKAQQLINSGELGSLKVGRRRLIPDAELRAFIERSAP